MAEIIDGKKLAKKIREILARDKDYFKCIMKPEASIMGEKISLDGSGDITND